MDIPNNIDFHPRYFHLLVHPFHLSLDEVSFDFDDDDVIFVGHLALPYGIPYTSQVDVELVVEVLVPH